MDTYIGDVHRRMQARPDHTHLAHLEPPVWGLIPLWDLFIDFWVQGWCEFSELAKVAGRCDLRCTMNLLLGGVIYGAECSCLEKKNYS